MIDDFEGCGRLFPAQAGDEERRQRRDFHTWNHHPFEAQVGLRQVGIVQEYRDLSLERAAESRGVELEVNKTLTAGGKLAWHASHQQRRGHAGLYYLQGGGAFVLNPEIVLHHRPVDRSSEVEARLPEDRLRSLGASHGGESGRQADEKRATALP